MLIGEEEKGRTYPIRQWLNVIFILLTLAGILIWYTWSRDIATYTLIAAVVVKFVEVTMRLMNI